MSLISGAVQDAGFANTLLCSDFFLWVAKVMQALISPRYLISQLMPCRVF